MHGDGYSLLGGLGEVEGLGKVLDLDSGTSAGKCPIYKVPLEKLVYSNPSCYSREHLHFLHAIIFKLSDRRSLARKDIRCFFFEFAFLINLFLCIRRQSVRLNQHAQTPSSSSPPHHPHAQIPQPPTPPPSPL